MLGLQYSIAIIGFSVAAMAQTVLRIPDAAVSNLKRTVDDITSPNYSARLFVASYDNSVSILSLKVSDTAVSLVAKPSNNEAGPDPTWLDLDIKRRKLFCLNEQLEPSKGAATLTEYDIQDDGNLKVAKKVKTAVGGPVHSRFLPLEGDQGVHVLAHYSPGTFTAFDQDLRPISQIDLAIGPPGPTKRQQEGKSNGHGVVVHKRLGNSVLVPDLGQDKVWVVECSSSSCKNTSSIVVPPGTGPRHGTIWEDKSSSEAQSALYLYVVGEISNKIEGFRISLQGGNIKSEHVTSASAAQTEPKEGFAAAEILTSPDGQYIVVSNRANNLSKVEECDPAFQNCTIRPSDTITTFRPKPDGTLENIQSWSAGGSSPRAFDFNAKGNLIAVGLNKRLAIIQRDVESGRLGQILIDVPIGDQVTSVVWDEVQDRDYALPVAGSKQRFIQVND